MIGPVFADGVVGRSSSWIAGVRAVSRDETAIPIGPRQFEKWRGKDKNEEVEKIGKEAEKIGKEAGKKKKTRKVGQ